MREAIRSGEEAQERLERALAGRFDADRVLLTGSGTQALQLALSVVLDATGAGRPVALPAYSCYDLVTAAVGAGARVVFYDVDPKTLNPDPGSLDDAVRHEPAVLVANGLFGFPLDWDRLRDAAARCGAVLVEDAAQGLGATWGGRPAGTFGDVTVLSFGRGKGWTGGGGGALLARGATGLPDRLPPPGRGAGVGALARVVAQLALGSPRLFAIPAALPGLSIGETVYKEPSEPRAPGAFVAATVRAHMELALGAAQERARHAALWRSTLAATEASLDFCAPLPGQGCGWLRAPLVAEGRAGTRLASTSAGRWGVARGYPVALPRLAQSSPLRVADLPTPGADRLARSLFTLPTHERLAPRDLAGVDRLLSGGS